MYTYQYPDYLVHHGVKGQKWGVRRYQNSDGSYTSAGRSRYLANVKSGVSSVSKRVDSNRKNRKWFDENGQLNARGRRKFKAGMGEYQARKVGRAVGTGLGIVATGSSVVAALNAGGEFSLPVTAIALGLNVAINRKVTGGIAHYGYRLVTDL